MTEQNNNRLYSYEENELVTAELAKIFSENISDFQKIKKLKALKYTVSNVISRKHIEYYIKKINAAKYRRVLNFLSMAVVTAYLIFTLFRVYWYFNPEYNPLAPSSVTITDLIVFLYVIPIVLNVITIIRKLFGLIRNRKK